VNRPLVAASIVAVLLTAAGLATWAALELDGELDRSHAGLGTAGIFAFAFGLVAVWYLIEWARRRRGLAGPTVWTLLTLAALAFLVLVAIGSNLGG
jgi:hypothetical protein